MEEQEEQEQETERQPRQDNLFWDDSQLPNMKASDIVDLDYFDGYW